MSVKEDIMCICYTHTTSSPQQAARSRAPGTRPERTSPRAAAPAAGMECSGQSNAELLLQTSQNHLQNRNTRGKEAKIFIKYKSKHNFENLSIKLSNAIILFRLY